jgi:hypothetical protein
MPFTTVLYTMKSYRQYIKRHECYFHLNCSAYRHVGVIYGEENKL